MIQAAPATTLLEAPATPARLPALALITPARNEADLLEATILSVLAQTVLPLRWIIVSDGSTDGTDEIVQRYAEKHPWIELLRMPERRERHFAAKAHAFNAGFARLAEIPYDIVGNLDADITFPPEYLQFLMERFAADPELGVAGTPFVEGDQITEHTYAHKFAQLEHVSGAVQLFRRACFEAIGGYIPIEGGAVDWIAVTTARMNGWKTRTFPQKVCFHHRKLGTGHGQAWLVRYRYGQKAYYVGAHPLWAFLRGLFQMRQKPYLIGGLLFQLGYWTSLAKRAPRPVSPDLIAFHRGEQMTRLWRLFGRPRQESKDESRTSKAATQVSQ